MAKRQTSKLGRLCKMTGLWFAAAYLPLVGVWWLLDSTVARWAEWHLWLVIVLGFMIAIIAGLLHRSWVLSLVLVIAGVGLYALIGAIVMVDGLSGMGAHF